MREGGNMKLVRTFRLFFLSVFFMLLPLYSTLNANAAKKLDKNWDVHKKGECTDCHETTNKAQIQAQIKNQGFEKFCKSCHPYHKINHTKDLDGEKINPQFVLDKGKYISCITCHVEKECRQAEKGESQLRGGPYAQGEDFCNQCHGVKDLVRKVSPHPYDLKAKTSCLICHSTGDEKKIANAKDKELKQPHEKLCQNCHTDDFHHMSKTHVHKRLDKDVETNLPLDSADKIFCGTCHVSHLKPGHQGNTRLPAKGNKLCLECHKFSSGL